MDFLDRRDVATKALQSWVDSGQVVVREEILEGLERAPAGLVGLLRGDNIGKRIIRVANVS